MAQDFGTPITPLQEPKKKTNTALIVVIVLLVLLCCCCVGIYVFYQYLGDPLLQWLEEMGVEVQTYLLNALAA